MPVYEYEPIDHDCLICEGRFECLQLINDSAHAFCPTCGMPCKRIVSKTQFRLPANIDSQRVADKGFTKYKKSGKGTWEKVSGEGADYIVGSQEDIDAVDAEKASKKKVIDLNKEP